jgi:hypothetical protein
VKVEGIIKTAKFTVLETTLMMIFMLLQPLNHYPQGWRDIGMLGKKRRKNT